MKHVLTLVLGCSLTAFAMPSLGHAQEKVIYRDRATGKEDAEAPGTIQEESAAQVVVKSGAGIKVIPSFDVMDTQYDVPALVRLDYGRSKNNEKSLETTIKEEERAKLLDELQKEYQSMAGKLMGDKLKYPKRHFQFKAAHMRARMAESDPADVGPAVEALANYKKAYPDSWQIIKVSRLLGQLQERKGDIDGAQKTYQELANVPNIPKETKQECDLLIAHALITGKKYAEARKRLDALQKSVPANDPQATRIQIYLAECMAGAGDLAKAVPQLEGLISKTEDKSLKALAYNALGDSYRLNGRVKDALWAYLWVDVLYHQDKQEHARAMEHLAVLFEELGDNARATQYRERIKREVK